ncbi:hypothetical protein LV779_17530 [Streptomyces thinghirensis]|nr:hypothetical protein [Streptomyces thinghirensis]
MPAPVTRGAAPADGPSDGIADAALRVGLDKPGAPGTPSGSGTPEASGAQPSPSPSRPGPGFNGLRRYPGRAQTRGRRRWTMPCRRPTAVPGPPSRRAGPLRGRPRPSTTSETVPSMPAMDTTPWAAPAATTPANDPANPFAPPGPTAAATGAPNPFAPPAATPPYVQDRAAVPPPIAPDGPGQVPYGYPGPGGYGHPGGPGGYPGAQPQGYFGWPGMVPMPSNGMGTAGLVLGIIAAVGFRLWPLAIVLGVLGVIFGGLGRAKAGRGEPPTEARPWPASSARSSASLSASASGCWSSAP